MSDADPDARRLSSSSSKRRRSNDAGAVATRRFHRRSETFPEIVAGPWTSVRVARASANMSSKTKNLGASPCDASTDAARAHHLRQIISGIEVAEEHVAQESSGSAGSGLAGRGASAPMCGRPDEGSAE